jgi:hypothetical protein
MKDTENIRTSAVLAKKCHFLKDLCHTPIQDIIISGGIVSLTKFVLPPCYHQYKVGVASNSTAFIPVFFLIDHLVENLKDAHTHARTHR